MRWTLITSCIAAPLPRNNPRYGLRRHRRRTFSQDGDRIIVDDDSRIQIVRRVRRRFALVTACTNTADCPGRLREPGEFPDGQVDWPSLLSGECPGRWDHVVRPDIDVSYEGAPLAEGSPSKRRRSRQLSRRAGLPNRLVLTLYDVSRSRALRAGVSFAKQALHLPTPPQQCVGFNCQHDYWTAGRTPRDRLGHRSHSRPSTPTENTRCRPNYP